MKYIEKVTDGKTKKSPVYGYKTAGENKMEAIEEFDFVKDTGVSKEKLLVFTSDQDSVKLTKPSAFIEFKYKVYPDGQPLTAKIESVAQKCEAEVDHNRKFKIVLGCETPKGQAKHLIKSFTLKLEKNIAVAVWDLKGWSQVFLCI